MEYEIIVYSKENGIEPFTDWVMSLKDKRAQNTVLLRIQRLRQGNFGDCKHFDGIHELRIDYGPGLRIYLATIGKKIFLILGGGDKHTQSKDIKMAKLYLDNYRSQDHE